jgi:TonB-dependent receptor
MKVTGSSFRNSYMKSGVDQAQFKGQFKLEEDSKLDFGLSLTRVKNRSAFSAVQQDDWGGAQSDASDIPDSVWRAQPIRPYFSQISGSNNPALFNQFFTWDFKTVRGLAAAARGDEALFLPAPRFDATDSRVKETSQSAFLQHVKDWDTVWPMRSAIGVRYEKTNITSTAQVPDAIGINWVGVNEFAVQFGPTPSFTTLKGSYNYFLPSIDFDVDVRDDVKVRASYGETIGRPGWGAIQGGQNLARQAQFNGGTGSQGNPALKPLKSKNFDLSFEWYYAKGSYAALGYFKKKITNFLTDTIVTATPFNLPTPAGGALWNEAVASGCGEDRDCIRTYIFNNYDGQFGVDATNQVIAGQPGDPIAQFQIQSQINSKRKASLDGLEFNVQHMFGRSGFGVSANYTVVNSDLKYKNGSTGRQEPLVGVSDSANLVVFYENDKWQLRAAYNWRDKFLTAVQDSARFNPVYTEAYGQLDINVSCKLTDRFSVHAEVINATDNTQRLHGRAKEQVLYVTQTGPRYMFGANYKF